MCESKELIVGYLYDELTSQERNQLQAHLAGCGECRLELEGLRATRTHLTLWSPPEPDLGFRVISGGASPAAALPRRMRFAPAFAFAAAAVIVLAVAAAIANVEVRYGSEGVMVRTGWASGPAASETLAKGQTAVAPPVVQTSAVTPASGQSDLVELDRRLAKIEEAMNRGSSGLQLASNGQRLSDEELLRRVRQIVADAGARHETATVRQMLAMVRDLQQQQQAEIARIQQGLDSYQGLTNAEIAQSRDMFNQWIRASARQEK